MIIYLLPDSEIVLTGHPANSPDKQVEGYRCFEVENWVDEHAWWFLKPTPKGAFDA